jgi:MFS family permease
MRVFLSCLAGLVGLIAGWAGVALLVLLPSGGGDQALGKAVTFFLLIGPIGGLAGLILGVWLANVWLNRKGRASWLYTVVILLLAVEVVGLWRSFQPLPPPPDTNPVMTLELQFRLPPDMALPPRPSDVRIEVAEHWQAFEWARLSEPWHGQEDGRLVIFATISTQTRPTEGRAVKLTLPGPLVGYWSLDLRDPISDLSPWRLPNTSSNDMKVEMRYRLHAGPRPPGT